MMIMAIILIVGISSMVVGIIIENWICFVATALCFIMPYLWHLEEHDKF